MLSRENCVYSWTFAGGIAKEKGGKQEMVTAASSRLLEDLDFRVSKTNSVEEVAIKHRFAFSHHVGPRILRLDETQKA